MNKRLMGLFAAVAMTATSITGVVGLGTLAAGAAVVIPPCTLTLSPNPIALGETLTVTVTGLAASETADVDYVKDGSPVGSGTITADSSGNYTNSVVLAGDLAGSVLGYTITGQTSGSTCTGSLSVLAATTTTETPPASDPSTTAPPAGTEAVNATPAFTG